MNLRLKRNDKIGMVFFLAFVISTSLIWFFEGRFSQEQWLSQPMSRYKMVDDLIESQQLIKKSKSEIIQILGEPNSRLSGKRDVFLYDIGNVPGFYKDQEEQLFVEFKNEKVLKVSLAVE